MKDEDFDEELLPTSINPKQNKSNNISKSENANYRRMSSDFDEIIDPENLIELSPRGRNIVFVLYLISNILISMDHGSIPASINELRQLTTYDQSIGLFGSLVYLGNIIGSMIFFQLINIYNRKYLLLISLLGNTICLFTFALISNIPFLFFNRIVVGILQSYITIVWTSTKKKLYDWANSISFPNWYFFRVFYCFSMY